MRLLYLYNATQTYTNTVYEHISAFQKYSAFQSYFAHQDAYQPLGVDFSLFDAIVIHYTIRLPFNQISKDTAKNLKKYSGLKVLFIQDEYDFTSRAWKWVQQLGIKLVFTVVPEKNISIVYPPEKFPGVKFVSILTGYVPENLPIGDNFKPPSERDIFIGYRGRSLPIRYGQLGKEKIEIGRVVKLYCQQHGVPQNIEWSETERIYGPKWYEFIASCRSMLGSESGCNVFDWDGTLNDKINKYRKKNPGANDEDVYVDLIQSNEIPELMNQISPRVFESIALGTALVLFEGGYSGVIQPDKHFIALKKDGSNLKEVIDRLKDAKYIDHMVEQAYCDVIKYNGYHYQAFVEHIDQDIRNCLKACGSTVEEKRIQLLVISNKISTYPIRSNPPVPTLNILFSSANNKKNNITLALTNFLLRVWLNFPPRLRQIIKPFLLKARSAVKRLQREKAVERKDLQP